MIKLSHIMVLVAVFLPSMAMAAMEDGAIIVGYIENVEIPKAKLDLKAKLDTGAQTTSVHATIIDITKPSKDSEHGDIIFTIEADENKSSHIRKPINRWVRIKSKDGGFIRRPVVNITFCIAGILIVEEANLSNRDHYMYDVLIGRNMLEKGRLIVDSAQTFTIKPECKIPELT